MGHPCRFDVAEVSTGQAFILMENAFDIAVRFADWVCGSIEWYRIFLTKLKNISDFTFIEMDSQMISD